MANSPDAILNDPQRLQRLRDLGLVNDLIDPALDRLTRLASKILNAPVSLVSLVESDRQFFKSFVGLQEPWASRRETPLSHSFCQHVVTSGQPLVVDNAPETALVRDNLAIPDLGVISYAGMPLTTTDNLQLGSFCVIDTKPRQWTDDELDILRELSELVMTEINLRAEVRARQLDAAERERLQADLIRLQANILEELSTPLIPITDEIVVMPLIGSIDSRRVNKVMETLLEGVGAQRAQIAIMDITGVPVIDTQVAAVLLRSAQAVQLLGADVMLTGIRPEIAQTLVSLGIDLHGITTFSTLQHGIIDAMRKLRIRTG